MAIFFTVFMKDDQSDFCIFGYPKPFFNRNEVLFDIEVLPISFKKLFKSVLVPYFVFNEKI